MISSITIPAFSQNNGIDYTNPPLNISTEDGSVSTYPYKLKVTNGTLVDNGDGTSTLTTGGGGGGGGSGSDSNWTWNVNDYIEPVTGSTVGVKVRFVTADTVSADTVWSSNIYSDSSITSERLTNNEGIVAYNPLSADPGDTKSVIQVTGHSVTTASLSGTSFYGLRVDMEHSGSGTVGDLIGIKINKPANNSGTLNGCFGLYVADPNETLSSKQTGIFLEGSAFNTGLAFSGTAGSSNSCNARFYSPASGQLRVQSRLGIADDGNAQSWLSIGSGSTLSATSTYAKAINMVGTINAGANNDTLYGIYMGETFSANGKTGVTIYDIYDTGTFYLGGASNAALNFSSGVVSIDATQVTATSVSFDTINAGGAYTFPGFDGTKGQVLTTDGAGVVSWATVSASGGGGTVSGGFIILPVQSAKISASTAQACRIDAGQPQWRLLMSPEYDETTTGAWNLARWQFRDILRGKVRGSTILTGSYIPFLPFTFWLIQ